jgi:hypothetical protein
MCLGRQLAALCFDPIPHILHGIPLDVRVIRVIVDRFSSRSTLVFRLGESELCCA